MVRLKPGHVQPVWSGHPWVFAQAVDEVRGGATAGDEISVVDPRGQFLGRGFYSPSSAIVTRILVRDPSTPLDGTFFRARIEKAAQLRARFGLGESRTPSLGLSTGEKNLTNGYRVVHAEGDGLPGLIVDRFGDTLVVQFLTVGMKLRERTIFAALEETLRPKCILDRTPLAMAKHEEFTAASGVVWGEPTEELSFSERGFRYRLSTDLHQKTGFYFDQRELRARVESLSRGARVLDAYSYVGAFSLAAARGGARAVTAVDESAMAIEVGAEIARDNGFKDIHHVRQDARKYFQETASKEPYDIVIADPPRLATSKAKREQALQGYAKLAELSLRAVKPGGLLIFCSCSSAIDLSMLTRALANGATKARMDVSILERHFQGPDHPVPAAFPEGLYLKALLARVERRGDAGVGRPAIENDDLDGG
ncbi:MAG: class I SAM-dependent rRNA methyltransferase [Polyangiaceae bacterium]|nr:class I SAM-dependent rRNA methyltransferase [Polyangiaceae bacterium]